MKLRFLAMAAGALILVSMAVVFNGDSIRLNHAEYLLNQQQPTAAIKELQKLKTRSQDNARYAKLLCRSYVSTGEAQKALELPLTEEALNNQPEIYYWKAVAAAQENDVAGAKKHAAAFVKAKASTALLVQERIIRSLAGEKTKLSPDPEKSEHLFRRLSQAEQAVYYALAAQDAAESGDYDASVQLWHHAVIAGIKRAVWLESAIETAVFAGSVNSAATFLHLMGEESAVDQLYNRFLDSWQTATSGTIVLSAEQAYSPRYRLGHARALAWIAIPWMQKQMQERKDATLSMLTNFHKSFPFDPFIQLRLGSVLELLHRPAEAESLYREVLARTPSLSTMLRYWSARGIDDKEMASQLKDALSKLNVVLSASVEEVCGASPCLRTAGQGVQWKFMLHGDGNFVLSFIASGIIGEGGWPLLLLRVDGKPEQYIYISRANWECYTCSLALDRGPHRISLECINPASASLSPGGFKLLSIIVSPAGEP